MPAGSMWYGRLAFNRGIVDNIHRMIDPDYAGSSQRAWDRSMKLHGQQYFAPRDSGIVPERAPDPGAMFRSH